MRTENIEVTLKIPIPVDKSNLDSMIYSKEAIKNIKNIPIEVLNNDGQFLPIGIVQEVELIKDENGFYITGIGLIREQDRIIQSLLKSQTSNKDMECMVFVPYRGKPVVIKNGEVVSTDNMTSFDVDWAYDRRTEVTVRGE